MFNWKLKQKIKNLEYEILLLQQESERVRRQLYAQQDDFYRLLEYEGLNFADGTRHLVVTKTSQKL